MDPRKGDVYKASLWVAKGDLVVKGKFLFFSRSQVWVPFNDFSSSFKKPDVSEFVPKIPRGK